MAGLLCLPTCGGKTAPSTTAIDAERFIATYVDLRVAALTRAAAEIADTARVRVLAEHDVSEDDLLAFADVHGGDLPFMRDVWNEVELRLDIERPRPDGGR